MCEEEEMGREHLVPEEQPGTMDDGDGCKKQARLSSCIYDLCLQGI